MDIKSLEESSEATLYLTYASDALHRGKKLRIGKGVAPDAGKRIPFEVPEGQFRQGFGPTG